jgi:ketosteroid isomerase-like protein
MAAHPTPESAMTVDPCDVLAQVFTALDRRDPEAMVALLGADVVLVDEISRRWLRGSAEVAAQFQATLAATSFVESRLSDLHSRPQGSDAVLVTGWLDQSYCLNGQDETISAPLSACLERQQGSWRLVSLHAVPLVENQA